MAAPLVVDGDLGGFVRGGDPATFYQTLWRWLVRDVGMRSVRVRAVRADEDWACIAHQYDRVPEWKAAVDGRFS